MKTPGYENAGYASEVIVHHLRVETGVTTPGDQSTREPGVTILVAATNLERWRWEYEDGRKTAVDAKDLVFVELGITERWAPIETVRLQVSRQDPLRAAALDSIPALFELAWKIHDEGWDQRAADAAIYGWKIDER
jgi:hypothetical protein